MSKRRAETCPVVCAEAWSRSEARPPVACRNLARSCAPKPGRVPKPGRRSHAEARPGRVRRSLAAVRDPKPGRAPVTARRGPARRGRRGRPGPARPHGEVRSGPVRSGRAQRGQAGHGPAGGGTETGKTDSTRVEITCACRRMTDRARRFCQLLETNREKRQSLIRLLGISLRIEKNGKVRRAGRSSRACVALEE